MQEGSCDKSMEQAEAVVYSEFFRRGLNPENPLAFEAEMRAWKRCLLETTDSCGRTEAHTEVERREAVRGIDRALARVAEVLELSRELRGGRRDKEKSRLLDERVDEMYEVCKRHGMCGVSRRLMHSRIRRIAFPALALVALLGILAKSRAKEPPPLPKTAMQNLQHHAEKEAVNLVRDIFTKSPTELAAAAGREVVSSKLFSVIGALGATATAKILRKAMGTAAPRSLEAMEDKLYKRILSFANLFKRPGHVEPHVAGFDNRNVYVM